MSDVSNKIRRWYQIKDNVFATCQELTDESFYNSSPHANELANADQLYVSVY